MKYSFSGQRYMTAGIQHSIPIDLQIYLWSLIDLLVLEKEIEPDKLQIIELASVEEDGRTDLFPSTLSTDRREHEIKRSDHDLISLRSTQTKE